MRLKRSSHHFKNIPDRLLFRNLLPVKKAVLFFLMQEMGLQLSMQILVYAIAWLKDGVVMNILLTHQGR